MSAVCVCVRVMKADCIFLPFYKQTIKHFNRGDLRNALSEMYISTVKSLSFSPDFPKQLPIQQKGIIYLRSNATITKEKDHTKMLRILT